jgi:hypothetical protein
MRHAAERQLSDPIGRVKAKARYNWSLVRTLRRFAACALNLNR